MRKLYENPIFQVLEVELEDALLGSNVVDNTESKDEGNIGETVETGGNGFFEF